MGGSTGGTASGKDSEAAAAIKLDLPVPRSPTTATRTPERPGTVVGTAIDSAVAVEAAKTRQNRQFANPAGLSRPGLPLIYSFIKPSYFIHYYSLIYLQIINQLVSDSDELHLKKKGLLCI